MSAHDPAFEKRYQAAVERARVFSASLEGPSLFERLARLPAPARDAILSQLSTLDLTRLLYEWAAWARPKQDPDLSKIAHRVLFWIAGRGFGKSVSATNRIRRRVMAGARSIAIVGPTLGEVEKYMITGEGGAPGLLTVFPPALRPEYRAHKRTIHFHRPDCTGCAKASCGGAIGYINTAEEPEFRGPNLDTVWGDEPNKWRYLTTIVRNIELSTRLPGVLPLELIFTSTAAPLHQFREWIADEETVTIGGDMAENAGNLDAGYVRSMLRRFDGTRVGRQELGWEILTDSPDALFRATQIDATRVEVAPPGLEIAVAIDPAASTERDNDETGIVVVGIDREGHLYVLADATGRHSPDDWGKLAIKAYDQWGASCIVVEKNRIGNMAAANVRAAQERRRGAAAAHAIKIVEVHASEGKCPRAEPVSTLHDRGRLHFVGALPDVEREICDWNPRLGGVSPNRLDALVWGCWHLARLGEADEVKPDYSAGFVGITAAAAQLQAPRPAAPLPGQLSGLSALLGARPGRHSTL